ncbi:uncharacterized protein LOC143266125 [Megachile rotundata]|uniref:uncharacterized protein LOC143266124 n=1 Tax=Megachile rotundata TaxID=143995 RepID=UPI003FD1C3FA
MPNTALFSDLLREQEELAGWIQRFWSNLCILGKDKITRAVLEQRMGLLDRYWSSFFSGHRALMRCKEAAASSYVQQDVFSAIEEAYLNTSAMIAQQLADRTPSLRSEVEQIAAQPQLPKIDLPTFSGDPLQWESFRDLFKSLVHDVPHLSDVKKLLYLKSSLTGSAAEVIQNTPITEAGYRGAWEDLELRYGNSRLLSFSHHRALLACPPAKQQSASELKRLLDTFRQTIRAYTTLKKPVTAWDEWFVYLLTQKLDKVTHLAWETSLVNSREIPSFYELSKFLENCIQALDAAQMTDPAAQATPSNDGKSKIKGGTAVKKSASTFHTTKNTISRKCPSCSGNHGLGYCTKFKTLSPAKRKGRAEELGVCYNCLNTGHEQQKCPSSQKCLACSRRHHTLLHDAMTSSPSPTKMVQKASTSGDTAGLSSDQGPSTANALALTVSRSVALLATARVKLEAPSGEMIEVRALLDTGSDSSFVTSWVAQALRLPRRAVRVAISGVQEQESGVATREVNFVVRSRHSEDFRLSVRALVLRKLTSLLPTHQVKGSSWPHLQGLPLADPDFGVPSRVDLILGADVCGSLFQEGTRVGPEGSPVAKLTPFGWVLMGTTSLDNSLVTGTARSFHTQTEDSVTKLLQRFWEVEEVREPTPLSEEEERCERHFQETHTRDSNGRYIVCLPFIRDPVATLKPSRSTALKLMLNCERRLASNDSLKESYGSFMKEYLTLNHMQVASEPDPQHPAYYLPHHAVVKKHDPTAKIRVVFNASFRTASGYSLNDCLATGPKMQTDLWLILTRWRLFRIAFTTDIIKMFRQIKVHQADADWQRILWRPNPGVSVQDYQLTTVTYGTACAPFLALRVLAQLAKDEGGRFPLGARAIQRHTYVDDILAGADDLENAFELKRQVISIFRAGGFELSKWASNLPQLQEEDSTESHRFHEKTGVSTLGVIWCPRDDTFSLRVAGPMSQSDKISKRSILSEVASFFDPLGWTAPVLIYAKILLQDLWLLGIDWDQDLPEAIQTTWHSFRTSFSQLDALSIPRWTRYLGDRTEKVELHGFCDASQRAYAAAVYLRVMHKGEISTMLLVAKTKVAPVKALTIPRLELCSAVLLSKLMTQVRDGLDLPATLTAWTDSSVALSWIRGHASLWKPFVAHRVSSIQTRIPADRWRHVQSSSNPADLATRGISPSELLDSRLWWHGPSWLAQASNLWPTSLPEEDDSIDLEKRRVTVHVHTNRTEEELFSRFSSLTRLLQVLSYCFRFSRLAQRKPCEKGPIRTLEQAHALRVALRTSQRNHFEKDIEQLRQGRELSKGSPLASLRPFLDKEGLLRVGGRLTNAMLSYEEKHPIIVAKSCALTRLLILDSHHRTLHGGPQLTRSLLLRKFWILRGGALVRSVIRDCVRCARFSGRPASQLMSSLPLDRITPHRPFLI